MAYIALAHSYQASFHDGYVYLHHAHADGHYRYQPQLLYKSHRIL